MVKKKRFQVQTLTLKIGLKCTIDNKKCSTEDYLDATQENAERHFKGKKARSVGFFGGFGKGTLKKPYKAN